MKTFCFLLALLLPLLGASAQSTFLPETDLTHLMSDDTWYDDQGSGQVATQSTHAYETFAQEGFVEGRVVSNTIEGLEPGTYELQFYAMACLTGRSGQTGSGENIAQVFANATMTSIEVVKTSTAQIVTPAHLHTLTCYVLDDGKLEYGIQNIAAGGDWYACQNEKLTYKSGEYPKTATISLAVDAHDYGTFVAPFDVDLSSLPKLEAYTISTLGADGKTLLPTRLTSSNTIPAYTPVLLYNSGEQDVVQELSNITIQPGEGRTIDNGILHPTEDNWLAGVLPEVPGGKVGAPNNSYVLQTHNGHTAFYLVDTERATPNVRKGRCYLVMPAPTTEAKAEMIDITQQSTGIAPTRARPTRSKLIYNLAGQRLQQAPRGLNIIDGHKVMK
ncbi:MAG: hypothetical protein KBT12_04015 [Bacteroidales bacterium]|nr:hypothetical protein [Candidatus Physcousia equi]